MNPISLPAALLQCAEVFILPSLVEGLSLALLEAMASGTACVATDAGADGEVLEGGAGIVLSTQESPRSCALCCQCCGISRCSPRNSGGGHRQRALRALHDQPQHRRHRSALRLSDLYRSAGSLSQASSLLRSAAASTASMKADRAPARAPDGADRRWWCRRGR